MKTSRDLNICYYVGRWRFVLGVIVIPEFGRLRQEDLEFQVSLGDIRRISENKRREEEQEMMMYKNRLN